MSLGFDERVDDDWLVLSVDGDLDLYAAPALRVGTLAALDTVLRSRQGGDGAAVDGPAAGDPAGPGAGALRGLVIDLERAPFMDSAGLGVIVWVYRRARADGTTVRLCSASDQVAKLFAITGLTTVVDLHPSAAAARASA